MLDLLTLFHLYPLVLSFRRNMAGEEGAGWKESHSTFVNDFKNIQNQGLTLMGPALKHTIDVLNINRHRHLQTDPKPHS
ncbi:integrator complex subunit 6-like isoform X3 [Crassostrea virginica]